MFNRTKVIIYSDNFWESFAEDFFTTLCVGFCIFLSSKYDSILWEIVTIFIACLFFIGKVYFVAGSGAIKITSKKEALKWANSIKD